MNLPDIVREVSTRSGIRQSDVSAIIKTTFSAIHDSVVAGSSVSIPLFGKFTLSGPKERVFRDPRTGERVTRMHTRFTFSPAQGIKNELRGE